MQDAIEEVGLELITDGDTILNPHSGNWMTITRTQDDSTWVLHRYADGEEQITTEFRLYYGDNGEVLDSRTVNGLIKRRVRP